jgi:hypothetical protein
LVPDGINGRYGIAKRARSACSKDRNLHDQSFKNLILDYPRQALAFFAGEEAGDDLEHARISTGGRK